MHKVIVIAFLLSFVGCSGCKDCNQVYNPVQPGYPCGTRAHACSENPLSCCWNTDVCGGRPDWPNCAEGRCCYVGDDYRVAPASSEAPVLVPTIQWTPGG